METVQADLNSTRRRSSAWPRTTRRVGHALAGALGCAIGLGWGSNPTPAAASQSSALAPIAANDNRVPAGSVNGGSVRVTLTARMGLWYPDGPGTRGIPIAAFGENGKPPQFPGPLLRVPAGTTVELRVRNALPDKRTLHIHGLVVGPDGDHPLTVRPGETRSVRLRRTVAGTFGYWTGDERDSLRSRFDDDAALTGAIVIDEPHRPRPVDRVFVIGDWDHVWRTNGDPNYNGELLTINGRSWPATEQLSYVRGQTVRWRVFNASLGSHPMHLHGFPFTLDAVGDGLRTIAYAGGPHYREVTHRVAPGETFDAHWFADRAGSWMFHCHIAVHTMPHRPLAELIAGRLQKRSIESQAHLTHDAMGSMMMAVRVLPAPGDAALIRPTAPRRLSVDIVENPTPAHQPIAFDRYAYVVHDAANSVPASGTLGPLIVLTAGEPVAITVNNHLPEATTVHWHGMPVQSSIDDGGMMMATTGSMSGMGAMPARSPMSAAAGAPPIAPGGSFVAQFTPSYAGTFMYHTHMDDAWQLIGGLSGPLIVLPRGASYDAATDHVIMLTSPAESPFGDRVRINGELDPAPIVIHAGTPQRLRFINMTILNADLVVSLDGDALPQWTPIAKDGLDLDSRLQTPRRAVQQLTIGETRDFTFTATTPGRLMLNAIDGAPLGGIPIDVVP
jgi:FtsP/CotA-like multicopper oxidase with cupredoxin domain